MKIRMTAHETEKRAIKTCREGEAFRWGDSWYTKIIVEDSNISNFDDFYERHYLSDMNKVMDYYSQAIPVFHLGSQSFCYANGEIIADEWADLTATLCVK